MPESLRAYAMAGLLAAGLAFAPAALSGQGGATGVRVGVSFGGIGRYGLGVEVVDGAWGFEAAVGSLRFADLTFSAVAKRYFLSSTPNPYVGVGLWFVTASDPGGRRGLATVLRVPVGGDWRITGGHHLGAEVNLNRALFVARGDPGDDRPVRGRIVPLPSLYYRYRFD